MRFISSALALLVVFAAVADAGLIEPRGTKKLSSAKTTSAKKTTRTTMSKIETVKKSSTKAKATSKTSTKVAKSTKKATTTTKEAKLRSAPTGVPKAAPKSASDVFCVSFVKQCFDSALSGQTGDVSVVHSCQRNGTKNSKSYTYSCKRAKKDLTKHVLNALAADYTVYTTLGNTVVVTGTATEIQTEYSTTTTTSQSAEATETETTIAATATSVEVSGVPSTTETLTTVIPVTVTTAYPATETVTTTTTSLVSTLVFVGEDQVKTYDVVVTDDLVSQRRRAVNGFCDAYGTACANVCSASSSEVRKSVCNANKAPRYTVACLCKNGKQETQHALAALVEDSNIVSITTVATSTSYVTATQTTTLPTAIVSVQAVTLTTTLPVTSTFTTLTTSTIDSTSTAFTGLSVTLATTSTPTTVQTNTATSVVPTTTNIVLAATGYARGFSTADGTDLGLLGSSNGGEGTLQLTSFDTSTTGTLFMAIRDPATGLYQLAQYGQPDEVVFGKPGGQGPTFASGTGAYSWMYIGKSSSCGSSGAAAGPPAGNSGCETFVSSPLGLDQTPGSDPNTVNMQATWTNPDGSQFTGEWIYNESVHFVYQVASDAGFRAKYPETTTPFTLRFPYTS